MLVAVMTTYSMVTLAASSGIGQISISGNGVLVNGEAALSGGTIFNGASIVTPDAVGATLNLGKAGRLELSAGSSFTVNVDGEVISGNLTKGNITVLAANQPASINTLGGNVKLEAGDTATAAAGRTPRDHKDANGVCIDDDKDGDLECGHKVAGWVWAAIVGGVATAVILAVTLGGDDNNSTTPTSPTR